MNLICKGITLTLLLLPSTTSHIWSEYIVWNVGQGQWVTIKEPQQCLHFDVGGENAPPTNTLKRLCANKKNIVFITHFDWDHISFSKLAYKTFNPICFILPKNIEVPHKKSFILKFPTCSAYPHNVKKIYSGLNKKKSHPNENSQVFIINDNLLISGDSTHKAEKHWASHPLMKDIRYFVVGHHGSHTSSSPYLLKQLKSLKLAIVSARKKRYGHPHFKVLFRFLQKKVPVATTETFGTIRIKY